MNYVRKQAPPSVCLESNPDHSHDFTSEAGPSTSNEPSFEHPVGESQPTNPQNSILSGSRSRGRSKRTSVAKEATPGKKTCNRRPAEDVDEGIELPLKRKPGRPRKSEYLTIPSLDAASVNAKAVKPKRGRPRKTKYVTIRSAEDIPTATNE